MALAAVAAVAVAGCSSPSPARHLTAAQQLTLRAEDRGPVLRLGLADGLADAPGLVAIRKGYFQQDLGSAVILQPVPYTSAAAEATTLAAERLDAAYLDPVAAVRLWQASRGKLLRVVAGAASGGTGARFPAAVLVVTARFLSAHPAMVTALLKGQVQGTDLLTTDKTAAQSAAATELTNLFGRSPPARLLAAEFAQLAYTDDPLATTMLTEARHAAAAGQLKPVSSLAGLFDLGPLNKLLRAAGRLAVPG
jgi:ABC-type nitrate/sulfonate/bicarbonate transport system substrate-binding protein